MADRSAFPEYAAARRPELRRLAYTLCGDWHAADDVVQIAFSKLYRVWPRVHAAAAEDAYVRKTVLHTAIDESRRSWRRERPVPDPPELVDQGSDLAQKIDIIQALQTLPNGQHKTVVLRYWLGMSVAETARALGVSEGTVKSQSAKALARLRPLLDGDFERSRP